MSRAGSASDIPRGGNDHLLTNVIIDIDGGRAKANRNGPSASIPISPLRGGKGTAKLGPATHAYPPGEQISCAGVSVFGKSALSLRGHSVHGRTHRGGRIGGKKTRMHSSRNWRAVIASGCAASCGRASAIPRTSRTSSRRCSCACCGSQPRDHPGRRRPTFSRWRITSPSSTRCGQRRAPGPSSSAKCCRSCRRLSRQIRHWKLPPGSAWSSSTTRWPSCHPRSGDFPALPARWHVDGRDRRAARHFPPPGQEIPGQGARTLPSAAEGRGVRKLS